MMEGNIDQANIKTGQSSSGLVSLAAYATRFAVRAGLISTAMSIGAPAYADWNPGGGLEHRISSECLPYRLERQYLEMRDEVKRRAWLRAKISDCEDQWTQGQANRERMRELKIEMPAGESFQMQLQSGRIISGWRYMQPDGAIQPAVFVECDFDCEGLEDPWVQSIYAQLFEEGGFHLFILQSPYSQTLASFNKEFTFGGLSRGADLLQFGLFLRTQSPIRKYISSLHIISKGVGGHAGLYALLYNDFNPIADDRKVFNGSLALCPVSDLGAAAQEWSTPISTVTAKFVETVNSLRSAIPLLNKYFPAAIHAENFYEQWIDATLEQYQSDPNGLRPFRNRPRTRAEFVRQTDFNSLLIGLKTPGWVIGAKNDNLVSWQNHSRRIGEQHADWKKSFLSVFSTEKGDHCNYPATHGWAASGAWLRLMLLSESYDMWPRRSWRLHPYSAAVPELLNGETHAFQRWSLATDGRPSLEFVLEKQCASGICRRSVSKTLDWSDLPQGWESRRAGISAQGFIRQLNYRLHPTTKSGQPLVDTDETPAFIEEFSQ